MAEDIVLVELIQLIRQLAADQSENSKAMASVARDLSDLRVDLQHKESRDVIDEKVVRIYDKISQIENRTQLITNCNSMQRNISDDINDCDVRIQEAYSMLTELRISQKELSTKVKVWIGLASAAMSGSMSIAFGYLLR